MLHNFRKYKPFCWKVHDHISKRKHYYYWIWIEYLLLSIFCLESIIKCFAFEKEQYGEDPKGQEGSSRISKNTTCSISHRNSLSTDDSGIKNELVPSRGRAWFMKAYLSLPTGLLKWTDQSQKLLFKNHGKGKQPAAEMLVKWQLYSIFFSSFDSSWWRRVKGHWKAYEKRLMIAVRVVKALAATAKCTSSAMV